ncbi:MAG: transcriptional regulator [Bacteroidota bacterium]
METLKYKVITTEKQYDEYCEVLEGLVFSKLKSKNIKDEIALLTLLIEKWDEQHNVFDELDPVQLLKSFMKDHQLKAVDLSQQLTVSPGLVSDILNYKKGFSKDMIRRLAALFKVSQEAFNRPYKLKLAINAQLKNASVMNTRKNLNAA